MLKYLIIIFFTPNLAFGQNERSIKFFFDDVNYNIRDKLFLIFSDSQKAYWLGRYEKEVGIDTSSNQSISEIEELIHFVDINHDSFPDIVDESWNGIAPVLIYLSKRDTFIKIVDEPESRLADIQYFGDRTQIITRLVGMVDAYVGESTFIFSNDTLNLVKFMTRRDCTLPPQEYFKHPLSIRTLIPNCPMRENPKITKGSCILEDGEKEYNLKNNILERFPQNTKGLAWGESHDTMGQKWWLVEFMSIEEPVYRANMIGWMRASDLEEF